MGQVLPTFFILLNVFKKRVGIFNFFKSQLSVLKMNKKLIFYFIILLTASPFRLFAQYSPYFENFSLSEYNSGNQNWGLSLAENGKLYVANNNGLLEYDGVVWESFELPNKTTIRSVFAYNDKIYTGSFEEFGYWKKNSKGRLTYTSLSELFDLKESLNEEFWQILNLNDTIVIRSFLNVYLLKGDKVIKLNPSSTVISCNVIDGELYVSTLRHGIFVLKDSKLIPFFYDDLLEGTKVVSIFKQNNKTFISTSLKGIYILENNQLIPFDSEINSLVKKHQLNNFSLLDNGNMVFGTIKNGMYYTNALGEVIFHVNKENGLINNTILGQLLTEDNKIWLGLDNGLARVNLVDNNLFYNDLSGKLGAVYDVINYNNTIYIGSNTGLYYLDNSNTLQFIENSQGQVWNLKEINGDLFCGHNNGTYLVKNKNLELISPYTGGWSIKKVPEQNNTYIQGTYAGLVKFTKNKDTWEVKHMGTTTIPARFLAFEDQQTIWAAHAYKGLFRIKFNEHYDSIVNIKSYLKKGLNTDYNVRVYKLKNNICFKTNDGWFKYEPLLDSIVPYNLLNKNLGKDSYLISDSDSENLVLKTYNNAINFTTFSTIGKKENLLLSKSYFKNRFIVGFENVSEINDTIQAISLNDGFMLINPNKVINQNKVIKPSIERISINNEFLKTNNLNTIEASHKDEVSIEFSSPKSDNHFFEYKLTNNITDNWNRINKNKLTLTNLASGDYDILTRTTNELGNISSNNKISLSVLPPWYKSNTGLLLYFFIVIILALLFYFLHKRKIKKEQLLLQSNFEASQKQLLREKSIENERKIVELKNQALENEIKLKSKQLANTAIASVKKNEALLEIKKELLRLKNNFDTSYTFKRLQRKIDSTIGHEDEWEIFEYNFNQVHEEYFNQLKAKHPNLMAKDLKICAYIKMNLTTKEIAPLMNISTRGVETQRYRLKKKLNLDTDNSLTEYLQSFN